MKITFFVLIFLKYSFCLPQNPSNVLGITRSDRVAGGVAHLVLQYRRACVSVQ